MTALATLERESSPGLEAGPVILEWEDLDPVPLAILPEDCSVAMRGGQARFLLAEANPSAWPAARTVALGLRLGFRLRSEVGDGYAGKSKRNRHLRIRPRRCRGIEVSWPGTRAGTAAAINFRRIGIWRYTGYRAWRRQDRPAGKGGLAGSVSALGSCCSGIGGGVGI